MNYIESKVENPTYFMFSDDIDWVKENFSSKHQMVFIDFNDASTNYEDIKLMSNCKHNIIGYQGRSFDPKEQAKYITIKMKGVENLIYGEERINIKKKIY